MKQLVIASTRRWRDNAPTKVDALRKLMANGRWHGPDEMTAAGGNRFSARLFDAHNSPEPLHYEKRVDERDDSLVYYRQTDAAHCDICTKQQVREKPSDIIRRQAERIAELERENEALRAKFGSGFGGAA